MLRPAWHHRICPDASSSVLHWLRPLLLVFHRAKASQSSPSQESRTTIFKQPWSEPSCSVRACMHDVASKVEPSGTAAAVVDMVRANKLGLVVVDASTAMEGSGPWDGKAVKMDLIIAGTNPLATDMVSASLMGFEPSEIPPRSPGPTRPA